MTTTVQMTGVARLDAIRAEFPALARVYRGHRVAYFDGPGGTQVPRSVADAMTDYLLYHNANTHWAYPTSVGSRKPPDGRGKSSCMPTVAVPSRCGGARSSRSSRGCRM